MPNQSYGNGATAAVIDLAAKANSISEAGCELLEADISVLPEVSQADVAEQIENMRRSEQISAVPSLGRAVRRKFLALLDHAIEHANLTRKEEFWDLLDLAIGLNVVARDLAVLVEVQPEMISRYRARTTAPTKISQRRWILRTAYDLAVKAERPEVCLSPR